MRDDEEIVALLSQRKTLYAPVHAKMREVRQVYDGDKVTDVPEIRPGEKPAVPNLFTQGIDQLAMRVASTSPTPYFPALKPGNRDSERYARIRRDVTLGWWQQNRMPIKTRKRARDLIGLGSSPALIRYDQRAGIPRWELKQPDECYPAPGGDAESITPEDCIMCFRKPLWWLLKYYPEEVAHLYVGDRPKRDDLFELVHYVDGEVSRLLVLGKSTYDGWGSPMTGGNYGSSTFVGLERAENPTGLCPVVIPGRISMGRLQSVFATVLGMYDRQARLMAIEEVALFNTVFPDPWLEQPDPNIPASVVTRADGRTGKVGHVKGGTIQYKSAHPDGTALNAVDRGERAIRTTVGLPADFGGESQNNVRTGRRGDAIVAAATDFNIQEAQELLEVALLEEDKRGIAFDLVYGADRPKVVNIAWNRAKGPQTYVPSKHWETDEHEVRYAMAGADATQLNIAIAQLVGTDLMSRETGMEMHPMIDDAEFEKNRLVIQKLDDAGIDAIVQQVASGTIPLPDAAKIKRLVAEGKEWDEAVEKVQEAAQLRQSTTVEPVEEGSPESMPGIAVPGMGAEAGTRPAIPAPPPSLDNLAAVLSRARMQQTQAA